MGRRLGWIITGLVAAMLGLVALVIGLATADQIASTIGAVASVAGLVVTVGAARGVRANADASGQEHGSGSRWRVLAILSRRIQVGNGNVMGDGNVLINPRPDAPDRHAG